MATGSGTGTPATSSSGWAFSDLYGEIQRRLNDTSATTLTSIKLWLNMTQYEVAAMRCWWWLVVASATVTSEDGTQSYALASDFHSLIRIRDESNTKRLEVVDWREFVDRHPDTSASSGTPYEAVVHGTNDSGVPMIWFWPEPAAAIDYTYDYYRYPAAMTEDTDTPAIPIQHRNVLLEGAWVKACQFRDRPIADAQTVYDRSLAAMLQRNEDTSGRLVALRPWMSAGRGALNFGPNYPTVRR